MTFLRDTYHAFTRQLDARAFPALVAAVVWPLTILADVLLLPLLIIFKDATVLVLLCNSYLNVSSATVASVILREDRTNKAQLAALSDKQDAHHAENLRLHQQTRNIGAAHQAMQLKHAEVATNLTNAVAALRQQIADRDDAIAAHLNVIHEALGSHLADFHTVLKEQVDVNKKVLAAVQQPQPRQKRVTTAPALADVTATTTPPDAPTATPEGTAAA